MRDDFLRFHQPYIPKLHIESPHMPFLTPEKINIKKSLKNLEGILFFAIFAAEIQLSINKQLKQNEQNDNGND